jgi:hypothetical protein
MSRDEIEAVFAALGDLARAVQAADPADKADIYAAPEDCVVHEIVPGKEEEKSS